MPDFSKRSDSIELMDDLTSSGAVIDQTLKELEFINTWLGGNAVTTEGIKRLLREKSDSPLQIADLGCGGGDMLKLLAEKFRRKNRKTTFTGIDANPNIVKFARFNTASFPEIQYQAQNILSDDFKSQQYDIILATLFLHHFTTPQLIDIFSSLKKQAKIGIVINDLHRHWLAYYSIKILTKLFSRSVMVKYDAPLSVLRGFKRKELIDILQKAGIENYSLRWRWAFRWELAIFRQCDIVHALD